ncbi:MAG TPA: SusC/RagA family TonB-linked outer membrane protein [Longimicrobiales bacterium]
MAFGRQLVLALVGGFLCASSLGAQGPTGTIAGRVVDAATRAPVAGATVSLAARDVVSGADGGFTIAGVAPGTHTIRVALVGYEEATQAVTVVAGETVTVVIPLVAEAVRLEELVVVGYGEQRAADLTGAVKSLSTEEFNAGRIVSPEQLIQGKVAGVDVVDTGEPGGGIAIRIRGGSSVTSSNEPLFVVDGVPLQIGGGISAGRNPLNFLNPDDIASITVLKDASATAIYGSRGSNGVILIETKTGRQAAQLTYTGTVSTSHVVRNPDVLGAEQFRSLVAERAPEKLGLLGTASTDWRDAVQRSAVGQEHSIAFAGVADNIGYRFSVGYLEQEGVVVGSSTERASFGVNYDHRLLDDRLNIRASLKGARTEDFFTPSGVLGAAIAFAPTQPIRDPSSPYGGFFEWSSALSPNNPVAELELSTDRGVTYRSVGNVRAEYRPPFIEGLTATVNLGYDVTKAERESFYPSYLRWQAEQGIGGQINRSNSSETNRILEAYVDYATRLEGLDSDLALTAGYTYEDTRGDFPSFTAQGLSFDVLGPNGVPAAEVERTSLWIDESRLISGFARLNYTFRDRYLLTLSVRQDGSSKFGVDNQWGTFPSAAFAWRLSEEPFLESFEALSDLKLRASWGVNGNQAFANYRAFTTYVIGDPRVQALFGDEWVTTIRPSAVDPNIKWEETTSYDIGVDFGLLDDRITGSVDYYHKKTEDLIFTVPVAAGTNLSNYVTTNIGSLKNEGLELSVQAAILDGADGGLSWSASLNAATNANELLSINPLASGAQRIPVGLIAGAVGNMIQVLQPGKPINSFFVYRHKRGPDGKPVYADGPDPDTSIDEDDLYEDVNGDGRVNQDDRVPFESPAPDWILGLSSWMTYGPFDLSFALRAHLGNYVYNNVASDLGHYSRLRRDAPENLHASVLETGFEDPQYFSDYYVEDASFLRMDNITLGYTFEPFRSGQRVRVFGTLQNAFTLTRYSGVDPTAGVNGIDNNIYPRSRTFTAGASVSF